MPSINKIVVFSRYDPNITPTGTGTETTSFHTAKMYYQAVDIIHKRALDGAALVLAVAVHELPLQRLRAPGLLPRRALRGLHVGPTPKHGDGQAHHLGHEGGPGERKGG